MSGDVGAPMVGPDAGSWVPVPEGSDFPLQNLPYGVFRPREGDGRARVGVAIGEHVLDLAAAADAGLLDAVAGLPPAVTADTLTPLLSLGRPAWRATRARLLELLAESNREGRGALEEALVPVAEVELLLPFVPPDYVDFYSSIEHASNMGRMFRPDAEALLPNWRRLPVGYHGRSGTVVASGAPVVRPTGQVPVEADPRSSEYRPTRQLDVEVEMGFVAGGPANPPGSAVPIDRAGERIFGMVLVNDWSARDIQRFEYQPLGPFLGKSFLTSISPWVVTLDALEPFRVPGPRQDPPPLPHLAADEPWGIDIELELELQSAEMARRRLTPVTISRANFRWLYWSIAQQLAHAASNGASINPGDLFASGTVSGPEPGTYGSLIELSWRGTRPIELPDGTTRAFLEDGDTAVIRGRCPAGPDRAAIGFGEVRGTVVPAAPPGAATP